jgi:hypothetical protein
MTKQQPRAYRQRGRRTLWAAGWAVWVCVSLAGSTAYGLGVEDLSFYATYDDSLAAVAAAGEARPQKVLGQYGFAPGILGKAVVAGERGKALAYAVGRNLDTQRGSISFWLKAMDWQAGDFKDHYLVSIPDRFGIRAASNSGGVHLEWENFGGATYLYPQGPNKNQWKHLVYTWGDKEVVLYQNGQFAGRVQRDDRIYFSHPTPELPKIVEGLFHICDPTKTQAGVNNTTVIDELMIFKRPLTATEVKNLYRRVTASLLEPTARIGFAKNPPSIDGVVQAGGWKDTTQFSDFVNVPFGNLSHRAIRANLAYDATHLYIAVRDAGGGASKDDCIEVWLAPQRQQLPYRFVLSADGTLTGHRGKVELLAGWKAVWQGRTAMENGVRSFEAAIAWATLGAAAPKVGDSFQFNLLRRWSGRYGDAVSWAGPAAIGMMDDPSRFGKIVLGGQKPVFVLERTGKLNYAQLDLRGTVVRPSSERQPPGAEVRLQPSDFKEYYDPKTLPGTKSYTGTQINRDRPLVAKGQVAELCVAETYSDTDIDSLWLKIRDASGDIIYQCQRPYVPQPPLTLTVKTFPDHDRLELYADVSHFHECPLAELRAEIELIASDKVLTTARIDKFSSHLEQRNLPLGPLPFGHIVVRSGLWKGKVLISEFTTAFDKLASGPWLGNQLGRDDVVIPPFTSVKVEGQSVSVWGRTYRWQNSLFPVQISSAGKDLLAAPVELVAGGPAAGRPNAAEVRVVEQSDTHALLECTGTIGGLPVTARHTIEYDGMCLTRLRLTPKEKTRLPSLSLVIPYLREQSTLYSITPRQMIGAVREKINPLVPPMNGGRDLPFESTVWLGNEDRGMTWFTEDGKGWRFKGNGAPLGIRTTASATTFTLRFAAIPLEIERPVTITFGLIATPVKPLRENWRFMRSERDWQLRWFDIFTASNNDIVHPFPSYKKYLEERHKAVPLFVVYQRPDWLNTHEPEYAYYGEEWLQPPRTISGSDLGDEAFGMQRHLQVCLGSKWQDFMLYYALKAFDNLHMDGYYFDGAVPTPCANAAHGHGWVDDLGNLRPTWTILAYREFFKRLQVEFHKRGRPTLNVCHVSGYIEMPAASFFDMQWNGENFSTSATPARDYNKLISLAYFRACLLGQPFGVPQQWLVEFVDPPNQQPIGKKEIDTVLELALVHGVGDNCLAGCLGARVNEDYVRKVLSLQDAFGVREKDCKFLPYWNNANYVSIEPASETLVCSAWQRPGKVLLILANATPAEQSVKVRLKLAALGLEGNLAARDLRGKRQVVMQSGLVETGVGPSSWEMILVEPKAGR